LDLPIDHFRLLGVHPATDPQAVLNTLQQRLENPPREGFTDETLKAREELLRASADLLSDQARRRQYENTITALAGAADPLMPALEVPYSLETGGLLLLLEAGQGGDCLELTCRALQPPQAPALGSGREADLALLAGLASRASADELKQLRRFEQAAQTLDRGLHLLQRMGQRPDLRQQIAHELDRLAPFRVLDLISRDLSARAERQQGLDLLEELVQRRGGLDGEGDPEFSPEEFRLFFRQIRDFLTVQEQVDLFSRWGDNGSVAADLLAINALTASGFAQRKPERIAEARNQLLAGGGEGIQPLLANLDLLLGDVEGAMQRFSSGAGPELRDWAERQSGDPLAQVCAWCRDWLSRDVLPGYRDLDADPDLEAYFSDRDVLAWVEREDRRSGRHYAPPAPEPFKRFSFDASAAAAETGFTSLAGSGFDWSSSFSTTTPPAGTGPNAGGVSTAATGSLFAPSPFPDLGTSGAEEDDPEEDAEVPIRWRLPALQGLPWLWGHRHPADGPERLSAERLRESLKERLRAWRPPSWRPTSWPLRLRVAGAVGLGLAAGLAAVLLRTRPSQPPARGVVPLPVQPAPGSVPAPAAKPTGGTAPPTAAAPSRRGASPAAPPVSAAATSLAPLTTPEPSDAELRRLLQSWLKAKAEVLAGGPVPAELDQIVRSGPIESLNQERRDDVAVGQSQTIDVQVEDISVVERSDGRLAVSARLRYRDERLDSSGRVVETTAPMTLRNVYVFGRDGNRWRLAATRSGG